jgi:hypothetical protein
MNKGEAKECLRKMFHDDQLSWESMKDNKALIIWNTEQLKKIVKKYGCITIKKFGEESSHYAWLVTQPANHDVKFQKYYLELMISSKDVLIRDIAYLTDRVLINQGKKQIYGTQFDPKTLEGNYSPFPIDDEEGLDARRKDMGLCSMKDYKKEMWEKYKLRA